MKCLGQRGQGNTSCELQIFRNVEFIRQRGQVDATKKVKSSRYMKVSRKGNKAGAFNHVPILAYVKLIR
eukprot:CAMPEP_0184537764 /NCGR_PEP_ID=MMETSP0198_2-20121128/17239_1 /TAXON_ID=1112570 /ORGANISM="Thraustochytrium sp., Strain LLF1b" /LENGTH=68 /DNA_ID=CAMNT_0026931179 /DNA_START=537 /DNA_END=743 /DNA_ORIENTATION=+